MEYAVHIKSSEIDSGQWDALLAQSPTATFFQSRAYYSFLETLPFLNPFVYAVSGNGTLKALLCGYVIAEKGLKHYFSRRAIILGGVMMAETADTQALDILLQETVRQLHRKVIYIEIRNSHNYSVLKHIFESNGLKYLPHYNFKIDTHDTNLLSQIGKSRIRDERAAISRGASVIENPTDEELSQWYEILKNLYKNRVQKPLFPYEFFEKMRHCAFARFFLVKAEGNVIGGTLCICDTNNCMYEWYACGLDREKYSQYFPSTVATMASIRYATAHEIRVFDMLGAGIPSEEYGVRNFKQHFGGKLVEEGRFLYICNNLLYGIGTCAIKYVSRYSW